MDCIIIGGFLGSGKTTFINYLLKNAGKVFPGDKTALLINEFGEMPVDALLMEAGNYSMREITGGCICCSLKGMLTDAIVELKENENPDLLVIEATGLAVPSEIAVSVGPAGGCSVFSLLAMDSAQYLQLAGKLAIYDRQLADTDMIFLTKKDLRGNNLLREVESKLSKEYRMHRSFDTNKAAAEAVFSCFSGNQENVCNYNNSHEKHGVKDEICQVTRRFSGIIDISELEQELSRVAGMSGPDLFRIKGIVETCEGWAAVQYSDGELRVKAVSPSDLNESFVVFIGKSETLAEIEKNF